MAAAPSFHLCTQLTLFSLEVRLLLFVLESQLLDSTASVLPQFSSPSV